MAEKNCGAAKSRFLSSACRIVSYLTLPAFLSIALSVVFAFVYSEIQTKQFVMLGLFTGLIPALAYPLIFFARKTGVIGGVILHLTEYIAAAAGYIGGVIYAFVAHVPTDLMLVYSAHLLCLIFLLLFNARLPLNAGRRVCLSSCPLIMAIVLLSDKSPAAVICASILLALMLFSSFYLYRILAYRTVFGLLCAGAGILAAIFGVGNIYS